MAAKTPDRDEETVGEIEMIAEYFAPLAVNTPGSLGLKDDAAYITGYGDRLIVTMDALVGGVHFFPDDAPADIAWKALAVNISDLVAKGARPRCYTMALALPGKPRRDWIADFASGLEEAQNAFGIGLLGGDTTATAGPITIAITAFGEMPDARPMIRRDGARPGHGIYVSGTIGDAALGLKLRSGDAAAEGWALNAEAAHYLVQQYLRPCPKLGLRDALLNNAEAAMDISDGLVIDLARLCSASGCGARVSAAAIPMSKAAATVMAADVEMFTWAISGGDDYEVLACIAPEHEARFEHAAAKSDTGMTKIGVIAAEAGVEVIAVDGAVLDIPRRGGYEHFS